MKNKRKSLEKNPKVFELPITSQTPGRILSGKASTPEENMAIYIFSCASLLKRPICTYSSSHKKGYSFDIDLTQVNKTEKALLSYSLAI